MMCLAHISNCAGFTRTGVVHKAKVSLGLQIVSDMIKAGKKCVEKDVFPIVRSDSKAVLEYVAYVCGQIDRSNAKQYVRDNYGVAKKLLGAGSFGKVYLFRNASDEEFAIKIPKNFNYKDLFMEVNASECIKEKTAGTDINDKFGVILSCPWPQHDNPNLVMKFLPESLTQFNKSWFSQPWSAYSDKRKGAGLDVMIIMAKEIALLHSLGIAHRDLKPDNIMVNSDQKPVIVDFGLTSPMGNRARTIGGTPYFLDYELMNGSGNGISADVYAMFIIYASMVCGKNFYGNLENYLRRGNYMNASNGRGKYNPKYENLNIPTEWSWLRNMYKPISSGRWSMDQVVAQLEKIEKDFEANVAKKEAQKNTKLQEDKQLPLEHKINTAIAQKIVYTRQNNMDRQKQQIVRPQQEVVQKNRIVKPKQKQYRYVYQRFEAEDLKNRPRYTVRQKISPAELIRQYEANRVKKKLI